MLKRFVTPIAFGTAFAVSLVSPAFAVPQKLISTLTKSDTNSHTVTNLTSKIVLRCQNCDDSGDGDPNPIDPPLKPLPQPTPASAPTPTKNYPATVKSLVNDYTSSQKLIDKVWNSVGKGIAAQLIKDAINGREFSNGVSGYNANVNLGSLLQYQPTPGPGLNQYSVKLVLQGNDVEFKTTTYSLCCKSS